jgi:hypothetical protein
MLTFTIKSHTDPTTTYTVTFPDEAGASPYCTCKGYGYRRMCSHITEATKQLDASVERMRDSLVGALQAVTGNRACRMCGAPLTGTHHKLDKCAACYREATFAS